MPRAEGAVAAGTGYRVLEHLDIENFKAFDGEHHVELAPITLFYGRNSAGKSTVLHALALLKQTVEPLGNRVDVAEPPLIVQGDLVDLGSFPTLIHRHETDRMLRLGVGFRAHRGPSPASAQSKGSRSYTALSFSQNSETGVVVQGDATISLREGRVRLAPIRDDAVIRRYRSAPGERYFALGSELSRQVLVDYLARTAPRRAASDDALVSLRRAIEQSSFAFAGRGLLPLWPMVAKEEREEEGFSWEQERMLLSRLNRDVTTTSLGFESLFLRMAYLGPLRAAPTRFQRLSGDLPTSVGARGENVPALLARNRALVADINSWFEKLGIYYRLSVERMGRDRLTAQVGDLLVTSLRDERKQVQVTPQDVGFGISQLLPVVVQLLSDTGRTVCVEQPEIHIHPALQAEFGDLMLEAASAGRNNQVIVETHSEHLILRLQRRIRESRGSIDPESICVNYVDVDESGRTTVQRLRLDERGRFIDEWPRGFFAERIEELFSGTDRPTPQLRTKPRD